MHPGYFKRMSLKTKMALSVTALFILFMIATSYFILTYFERTFKETISAQQFSLVSSIAHTIDDKMRIAQDALLTVATTAPMDAFVNVESAQRFLNNKSGLRSIFDNNTAFITLEGKLFAEGRYLPGRRGKDLSYREWFQKTIASEKPYISNPFISTHSPIHPAVMMTVPIFDTQGKMKGMLVGSFDLLGKNILADLSGIKIGKEGYLYITDNNRIIIVHPEKARIMKPAATPGVNRMYDQAVKGFEGSGETVTSYGIPMLSSFKHLKMASWILAANYPISEAYAPLEKARRYLAITVATAMVMLMIITWLIMRRLMSPLTAVTRHVEQILDKTGNDRLIEIDAMDEIGVLATQFNCMVNGMDRDREFLKAQKEKIENERVFLETLINAIPDMVFVKDKNSVYLGCNDACASMFMGLTREEIKGYTDYDFLPTSDADFFRQKDRETMESGELVKYEQCHNSVDGHRVMVETFKVPFRDTHCNIAGIIGISRDITERKLTEEKLHEQAEQLERGIAEKQKVQEALAVKQLQLEELNHLLEERIFTTVHELRQKDQILIKQSRQAAMGEMIGNIAHQWRQPLNTLGLMIQELSLFYDLGQFNKEFLDHNVSSSMVLIEHMSKTIDDFRNYFRPDKEKVKFKVEGAIANTLSLLEGSLQNPLISIEIITKDKPVIYGYQNEFAQVLLNILINARDVFIERKVKSPRVTITTCCEDGCAVVTIADNAGGIPEEIMGKIFDPYFTTKGPQQGTGVGLFMSKSIIEKNMGGRLDVRNTSQGAEFRIEVGDLIRIHGQEQQGEG